MNLNSVNLKINKKFNIFIGIISILLALILFYLYYLQVYQNYKFYKLSQNNFLRYELIPSIRGQIIDCNGNILATNKSVYQIYWQGTGNHSLNNKQIKYINCLINIFSTKDNLTDKIIYAERKSKKIKLEDNVEFNKISQLIEILEDNKNIIIEKTFKRFYPHKSLASHIIGHLSQDDNISGKMGLEKICEDILKGQPGKITKIINSIGNTIGKYETKKVIIPDSIQTTIDIKLQEIANNTFPKEYNGTFILFDPIYGNIDVLLSWPEFDPNIFLEPIDYIKWTNINQSKCFINRAINACYPPASIFKLITATAALEKKIINNNTKWHCKGHISYKNRNYHCVNSKGHGIINIQEALAYSCNIPFYDIAQKLDIDYIAEMATKFGLGTKTNIILPESQGLIPTKEWKLINKNEIWWPGENLSVCIGQSYILTSPIQIAKAISAIFTSKLIRPRILVTENIIKEKIDINKKTLNILKNAMKKTILLGTAQKLNNLKDFDIYAKTGTAQTHNLRNKNKNKSHTWLALFFKYKNYQPKTIVLLLEHANSINLAISTVKQFLEQYKNYLENI